MAANRSGDINVYSADKHTLNTLFAFCVFCVFWVVFGLLKVHFLLERSPCRTMPFLLYSHTPRAMSSTESDFKISPPPPQTLYFTFTFLQVNEGSSASQSKFVTSK